MKKVRLFLIALLSLLCAFSVISCQGSKKKETQEQKYVVTTNVTGQGDIRVLELFEGQLYDVDTNSIPDGITLRAWVTPRDGFKLTRLEHVEKGYVKSDFNNQTSRYDYEWVVESSDATINATFEPVSVAPQTYNITINGNTTYGNVTANKSKAAAGETITFTINITNSDYELDYFKINNVNKMGNISGKTCNYTMPEGDVTVNFAFKKKATDPAPTPTYTIAITTPTNGSVTASKTTGITSGQSITLTIAPNSGYRLKTLMVGGANVTTNVSNNKYTFTMPANNVSVSAVFEAIPATTYTITITTPTNGTITATKTTGITSGTSITLETSANTGYRLATLIVDGTNVKGSMSGDSYTFKMPAKNITVSATFEKIPVTTYNITVKNGTGTAGSYTISVDGSSATSAAAGKTVTITFTGNLANVTSSDVTLNGSGKVYTFTMPAKAVSITANWATTSDTREYVSHLILGDSYTDVTFWKNFYSDMKGLPAPKTIGVGGTVVDQWTASGLSGTFTQFEKNYTMNIQTKYNVQNFVFHIGVNDIDGGESSTSVFNGLKAMFEKYHNAYPQANFYWISLSKNTMFDATYGAAYNDLNAKMSAWCQSDSFNVTYIDTVSVMFPNNVPNGDWFGEGLHFNTNGYATWSSLILKGLGVDRQVNSTFGSAGAYYSSNTWTESNGIVSNVTPEGDTTTVVGTFPPDGQQSLWFKNVYSANVYAEMEVKVNKIANNDAYPKFGFALKNDKNHVFLFLETNNGLWGGVSFLTPTIVPNKTYYASQGWDWSLGDSNKQIGTVPFNTGCDYIKISLLKSGKDIIMYINGVKQLSISNLADTEGAMAVGVTSFNTDVSIRNASVTTDIQSVLNSNKVPVEPGMIVRFDPNANVTIKGNSVTNKTAGANQANVWVNSINHTNLYYEADITLDAILNNDQSPKAGFIVNQQGTGSIFFFVDVPAALGLGNNPYFGAVYREEGSGENWNAANWMRVQGFNYTNSKSFKLGLLKQENIFVLILNGNPIMRINLDQWNNSKIVNLRGNVNIGFQSFNLAYTLKNFSVAVSDTIVTKLAEKYHIHTDVVLDGDLATGWDTNSTSYGKTIADGRGLTVWAKKGTNGLYVAYKTVSNTLNTTNNIEWFNATNYEMFVGGTEQAYVSLNGSFRNVLVYGVKTSTSGSQKITIAELFVPWHAMPYTSVPGDLTCGFAFKAPEDATGLTEGNAGNWWCGDKHASAATGQVSSFRITSSGIVFN